MYPHLSAIDYLAVGHLACDKTSRGDVLGGTVAYASRTARQLGLSTGIVTSFHPELDLAPLSGIQVVNYPSEKTTTFQNQYRSGIRTQYLYAQAQQLTPDTVPVSWRSPMIVHLAPIAREIDLTLPDIFPDSFLGITPQGWLRNWDQNGRIHASEWREIGDLLARADAVVVSLEDIDGDENTAFAMAKHCSPFALTLASQGARVYFQGEVRQLSAPKNTEIESTGAGDIFAAAFFIRYHDTEDPWEAGRFANRLASTSITRVGLGSTPTEEEIYAAVTEAAI
jgi:sugar/nucleoside kinase (ribokinase family)